MKNVLSILGVLLLLSVASVSAYHMTGGGSSVMTVSDRNMNCDHNPYDSIDTCDRNAAADDRQTVSNSQFISDRQTVSDTSDTWLVLQCRVADDTMAVSDRGQTRSTFGRSTAANNTNSSMNNVFDRQTMNSDRVNVADMEMLECYVVETTMGQTMSDRQTVSDASNTWTVRTSGSSWSDQWDYNNPNRMTTQGAGQRMDSDTTRGFESPVVYQNTLDTTRTSEEQAD